MEKKSEKRSAWLQIRVTPTERDGFKKKAKRSGQSLSAWILHLIRRAK